MLRTFHRHVAQQPFKNQALNQAALAERLVQRSTSKQAEMAQAFLGAQIGPGKEFLAEVGREYEYAVIRSIVEWGTRDENGSVKPAVRPSVYNSTSEELWLIASDAVTSEPSYYTECCSLGSAFKA
jgi:hypothetical protein